MWLRPKLNFSEYGHVAYQIKGNVTYSNMVANILPADIPLTPRVGSKGQNIFCGNSHVAYQIKGDGKHHESKFSVFSTKA